MSDGTSFWANRNTYWSTFDTALASTHGAADPATISNSYQQTNLPTIGTTFDSAVATANYKANSATN